MNNLEWIEELIPEENGWVHGCISNALDKRDNIIRDKNNIISKIQSVVDMTEEWVKDQSNGITDMSLCISAMRDIRRILKGDSKI